MACLVRRTDLSVAYITKDNISRVRVSGNIGTPRPLPNPGPLPKQVLAPQLARQPSQTNSPTTPRPLPNPGTLLVRQPSLKPSHKTPRKTLSIGEKRNISKQELNIILNSLKEIRTNIRYTKFNTFEGRMNHRVYRKQLKELNAKLC